MMVIVRMLMLMIIMVVMIAVMTVTGHREAVVNPRLCPGLTCGSQVMGE